MVINCFYFYECMFVLIGRNLTWRGKLASRTWLIINCSYSSTRTCAISWRILSGDQTKYLEPRLAEISWKIQMNQCKVILRMSYLSVFSGKSIQYMFQNCIYYQINGGLICRVSVWCFRYYFKIRSIMEMNYVKVVLLWVMWASEKCLSRLTVWLWDCNLIHMPANTEGQLAMF